MSDLIDRQAAIDALKSLEFRQYMEFGEYVGEDTKEVCLIRAEKAQDALQSLPSAQRMKSRWYDGRCLRCGEHAPFHPMASAYYESNFCPSCGADMRGEQE